MPFRMGPLEIVLILIPVVIAIIVAMVILTKRRASERRARFDRLIYDQALYDQGKEQEEEAKIMTEPKGYISYIPNSILDKLPVMVKTEIVKLSPEKQGMFIEEFRRKRKSVGLAYFLWFIIGFHYIYLGKVGWQFFYWFTLGGLLIWTIVDLFRIPGMVGGHNRDVATDVLRDLKIICS